MFNKLKQDLDKFISKKKSYKNGFELFENCKIVINQYPELTPEEYNENIKYITKELGI